MTETLIKSGSPSRQELFTVLDVCVGSVRSIESFGRMVTTGIFKEPVLAPVMARTLGLEGDAQADRSVHGGTDKAIYVYPKEHYTFWERLLETKLAHGSFGENITSLGLQERDVFIGDTYRCGEAIVQAIQPRSPCYKLQARFERQDMTALFAREQLPGWYASVIQEGLVRAGDRIELLERSQDRISITDIWLYSFRKKADVETCRYISTLELLPGFWKMRIER